MIPLEIIPTLREGRACDATANCVGGGGRGLEKLEWPDRGNAISDRCGGGAKT